MNRSGYLQARIQARYATLPSERLWRELAAAGDLSGYLSAAQAGGLAPWLKGITPHSGSDEIEQGLRKRFSELIVECAGWCDTEWRASVLLLPRLYQAFDYAEPGLNSLVEQWRDSLPASAVRSYRLTTLIALISEHLQGFVRARPSLVGSIRAELEVDLRKLFRHSVCRPEALFIWLALVSLLLEKLRGELVVRALFTAGEQPFRSVP